MIVGEFYKLFYVRKETIPIITLNIEQLRFLIFDEQFNTSLSPSLLKVKEIFVVGCTVGLRISDLLSLRKINFEKQGEKYFLRVLSQKTNVLTRMILPNYVIEIFKKYSLFQDRLLPKISKGHLNRQIKVLIRKAGWTEPVMKSRSRLGQNVQLYKNHKKMEHFQFCDLVSSHTMRRTAISTMLNMGMPEHLVRKLSGHCPASKEFFRYVAISQSVLDKETELIYDKLRSRENNILGKN